MKKQIVLLLFILINCFGSYGQVYNKLKPIKERNQGAFTPFEKKGLFGYINDNGKVVIKNVFEEAYEFHNGYAIVKSGGKYGLISQEGIYSIFPNYDGISNVEENRVIIEDGNLYGFCSPNGDFLVEPKYRAVEGFIDGKTWVVKQNGKLNVLDLNGHELLSQDIILLKSVGNDDFYTFKVNYQIGLLKYSDKKIIFDAKYDDIDILDKKEDLYILKKGNTGEIKSSNGILYLPMDENATLKQLNSNVYGQINQKEKKSVLFYIDSKEKKTYHTVVDGDTIQVVINDFGKRGLLDENQKEVLPCEYDSIGSFNDNMCLIIRDGLTGYIDNTFKEVIEAQYSKGKPFINNRAVVTTQTGEILSVDKNGIPDLNPENNPYYIAALVAGKYHKSAAIQTSNNEIKLFVDNDIELFDDNSFSFSLTYYFAGVAISKSDVYLPGGFAIICSEVKGVCGNDNGHLQLYATDKEKTYWIENGENEKFTEILNDNFIDEVKSIAHNLYLNFQPDPENVLYQELANNQRLNAYYSQANISKTGNSGVSIKNGKIHFGKSSAAAMYRYTEEISDLASKCEKLMKDYLPTIVDAVSCSNKDKSVLIEQIIRNKSIKTSKTEYKMIDSDIESDTYNMVQKLAEDAVIKHPIPTKKELNRAQQNYNKYIDPAKVPKAAGSQPNTLEIRKKRKK